MSQGKQIFILWTHKGVENNKLMMTSFAKSSFSEFFICVINGSGVSFDQVPNLLEFIPHYMTALSVYMCLDFQTFYNFKRQKMSTCVSL